MDLAATRKLGPSEPDRPAATSLQWAEVARRPIDDDVAAVAGTRGLERLDRDAKAAYHRRIAELRDELEEAEQFNDHGRTERARAEMDAIAEQLAAAVGLGGRDRLAASASERARSTITQRLRGAIRKIGEHQPGLANHLHARVKTGTFCLYSPDPMRPIEWEL